MDALAQLEQIAQQIARRPVAIQQARDEGYTWDQIAAALEMSRAGAIKLYNATQTGTAPATSAPGTLPDLADALAADVRATALEVAHEYERTAQAIRRLTDDPNLDPIDLPFAVAKAIESGTINASASRIATRGAAIGKAYRSGAIPAESISDVR